MKTFKDLLLDYWFESFEEFINILEKSDREWENNLFFKNGIDLIKELFAICNWMEKQNEALFKKAFEVWRLVQMYRYTDAQFTEKAEKNLIKIQEKLGDLVEDNPSLEELLPKDISWI